MDKSAGTGTSTATLGKRVESAVATAKHLRDSTGIGATREALDWIIAILVDGEVGVDTVQPFERRIG